MPEIGQQISHYRILEKIGAGGMGEVYLADDQSLDRKVALKFLPEMFTGDPERMARFEREAKLLASLNHPNIAAIYGLEQADGKRFLVMEYVEGETLQARLSKGALPLEDALALCHQIAEGLGAAHEKAVIHRDLKPANVMITAEEKVKILDFGLAKALLDEGRSVDSSQSPTITEAMTQPGVVLGTAAYMSPEQAKGKAVDKRADIWAFGCILYECLSGKKAFEGETVTETLAAVIRGDPDWSVLPTATSQNIRFVLNRCLEKDPVKRFRDAADVQMEIEEAQGRLGIQAVFGTMSEPRMIKRSWFYLTCLTAAVFALMALCFGWFWFTRPLSLDLQPVKFWLLPPEKGSFGTFAISPNGKWLAFVTTGLGKDNLWVRALDELEPRVLPGTEGASSPFWSPDSRFVGFFDGYRVKKTEVSGGPVYVICEEDQFWQASWNQDGEIIFNGSALGLQRVPAAGGEFTILTRPDAARQESDHFSPSFLPDGRHFFYGIPSRQKDIGGVYLGSLDGEVKRVLVQGATDPVYASSGYDGPGYLFFKQGRALFAQRFEHRNLELAGESFLIDENIGRFSVSSSGALVFDKKEWTGFERREYLWVDRVGKQINPLGVKAGYFNPSLSRDGKRIAADRINSDKSTDIWLYDAQGGGASPFTFDPASDVSPVWSPDGSDVIFTSNRDGNICNLYLKPSDGARNEELLFKSDTFKVPTSWSSDGKYLIFTEENPKTNYDIWVLPLEDKEKPHPLLDTESAETNGQLSPDCKWLAYQSNESGRNEIYLQSFPNGERKKQISFNGGINPQWRGDGKELFYYEEGRIMAVQVKSGGDKEIDFAPAIPLFDYQAIAFRLYAVSADGQRFLIAPFGKEPASPLTIILNWPFLLEKK
jgi:WD40 repeat protein/predicted Ser/Thr protein kinase